MTSALCFDPSPSDPLRALQQTQASDGQQTREKNREGARNEAASHSPTLERRGACPTTIEY
jgi:hypothetical protein